MAKKKILFINQEISPYVPDNAMSVMGRELPRTMQDRNHEIRTFMPKWGNINERRGQLHEVIRLSGINLIIDDTDHPLVIKVASIPSCRVQVYFIDNDDYFSNRQMTVDENGLDYPDNGERAIFFARGVLETVKKQCWVPDIIHVQGWMGAVVPLYIKTAYHDEPSFANTKVVTSLFTKSLNSHTGNRKFRSVIYYNASKLHHSIFVDLLSTLRSFANLHLVITRCIIIHFLSVDVGAKGHGYSREKEPLPHSSYYVYSILHIPLVFFCRILFIILKIFRL